MNSTKLLEGTTEIAPPDWTEIANVQGMYGLPSRERTLGDYWRLLRKRKWTVIVSLVVVPTIAALISLRMTPIYDAVARISISNEAPNILNFKDSQQYTDSSGDQDTVLATQVHILQSNNLALQVIRNLGLNSRSEFAGKEGSTATNGLPVSGSSDETLGREDQLI